ncbi:MAG: hypothetical protein ACRCX8_11835 [Sarcina sp.]
MQYYIDKSKLDYFTYGGTSSASFNFIITDKDDLNGFENDFELVEIMGRSGDLIVNNNRKKNKSVNIEGYIDLEGLGESSIVAASVRSWLTGEVAYKELTFSDSTEIYQAIVLGALEIKEEYKGMLTVIFAFSCKPFKEIVPPPVENIIITLSGETIKTKDNHDILFKEGAK